MRAENLLEVQQRRQKCTVGCPVLDRWLCGGIPCESVTELVGESGCGKTQLCLQLAISAQLPPSLGGLSASSIFIHTEFPFPFRRLLHLSATLRARHTDLLCPDPCDRVFLRPVHSALELLHLIPTIENFLLHSKSPWLPVRILLIDSIAALFRSDFDNTGSDLRRRSSLFFRISGGLRRLANKFGIAVVVTNQVVDVIGDHDLGNLSYGLYSSGRRVCPALGLSWAHCVNSRVFLSKDENSRRMSVVFAPHLPPSSCDYLINGQGLFGLQQHSTA